MITFLSWLLITFGLYGFVTGGALVLFALLWTLYAYTIGFKSAEDWANEFDRRAGRT